MLRAHEVRVAVVSLIDERLERDGGVVSRKTVRSRSTGDKGAFTDTARDFFREFLLVGSALGVLRFGGVGEEAAFDQHGRNRRSSQNKKASPPHTAVASGRAASDVIVNGGSERQTLRTIVNANKDRVSIRISNRNARSQRNEDVAVSRHHNAIAISRKHSLEPLRYIEIHHAFRHTLMRNSAAIESAMSSVDDNGC